MLEVDDFFWPTSEITHFLTHVTANHSATVFLYQNKTTGGFLLVVTVPAIRQHIP